MFQSLYNAKQTLLASQYITSYGNLDIRSDEAQEWLMSNGFNLEKKGKYIGVDALIGFSGGNGEYGERDRYAHPDLIGIYLEQDLPIYSEEDKLIPQVAEKIAKYEARKTEYLAEGEYARSISFDEYLANYKQKLAQKGLTLDDYKITEEDVKKYYETDKSKVSYDHVSMTF